MSILKIVCQPGCHPGLRFECNRLYSKMKIIPMIILCSLLGCSSSSLLPANYLLTDTSKNIRIRMYDKRVVSMKSGDYSVIDYTDSAVVVGKGIIRSGLNSFEKEFNGSINMREILEISANDGSSWMTAPAGIAASALISIFILTRMYHWNM